MELVFRNGDTKTITKLVNGHVIELLGLVRRVFTLGDFPHAIALDGLDQQHRGLAFMAGCCRKGSVDLVGIMAPTVKSPDVLVAHAGDHLQQFRVLAEEVLANIGPIVGLVVLVLAIDRVHHDLLQDAVLVLGQQRIPVRPPDHLDHVPT